MTNQTPKTIEQHNSFWVPVRLTDGNEWYDHSAMGITRESAELNAKYNTVRIPHWVKDNPVIRYAHIRLEEIS